MIGDPGEVRSRGLSSSSALCLAELCARPPVGANEEEERRRRRIGREKEEEENDFVTCPTDIYTNEAKLDALPVFICGVLNWCGKRFGDATRKAKIITDNVWRHLRTSPSVTDAAMARLAQGTKVLAEGGQDKVFQQTFEILPGEKLLKAYACYLSTSTGPVIGTLYLSNKRLAFCSDNPLCQYSPSGQQQWMYYKVVLLLNQLSTVSPSSNRLNPTEKYIQVVTRNGFYIV